MHVRVNLTGYLKKHAGNRDQLELEVAAGTQLGALIDGLGIPRREIGATAVNGCWAGEDVALAEGDVIDLVPLMGGGSPIA